MIISPPFLPSRPANQTDDAAYVDFAMQGGEPGNGGFPVSFDMNWHGGLHLQAPSGNHGIEPVRAIADGTVVYVRKPREPNDNKDDPLNYCGGWSSDGCVILRHETEIGEGGGAHVIFYSIYLHLSVVAEKATKNQRKVLASGDRVLRKDEIGTAGWIYGQPNRLHLEIIADDANLARLVGRSGGDLSLTANGRIDSCWGDMYFYLPAGTPFFAQRPAHTAAPGRQALSHTSTEPLFVQMHFERGDCTMTTRRAAGTVAGTPLRLRDYEYDLYRTTTTLYPNCPSAGYELLRFGRVLGPDALNPANAAHWREVAHPNGSGWVDLNAADIRKFSDADFPHWMNWKLIVDDDGDSHCDAQGVINLLDTDNDGKVSRTEAMGQLRAAHIRAKADRMICKFPTEWERGTLRKRWNWLLRHPDPTTRMEDTPEQFGRFERHNEALCFWEDAALDISATHWHFQPREFIKQFRKCGWLSLQETERTFPKAASSDVSRFFRDLNLLARKYLGNSSVRKAHFYGQMAHESSQLASALVEVGNSRESRLFENASDYFRGPDVYFNRYEGNRSLGNVNAGDGIKFRGRGAIQLTGLYNYTQYWLYRGWLNRATFDDPWWDRPHRRVPQIQDPQRLSAHRDGSQYDTLDSSLAFWSRRRINVVADGTPNEETVRQVTGLINSARIHLRERVTYTRDAYQSIGDDVP